MLKFYFEHIYLKKTNVAGYRCTLNPVNISAVQSLVTLTYSLLVHQTLTLLPYYRINNNCGGIEIDIPIHSKYIGVFPYFSGFQYEF